MTIWTALELASGIICASLPSIRLLMTTLLSKYSWHTIKGRSQNRSTATTARSSSQPLPQRKESSLFHLPSLPEEVLHPFRHSSRSSTGGTCTRTWSHARLASRSDPSDISLHVGMADNARIQPPTEYWTELMSLPRPNPSFEGYRDNASRSSGV